MVKLSIYFCVTFLVFVSQIVSQGPPPPASGGQTKKFSGWPSIASVSFSDEFISLDGRFRIGLPKHIGGFAALSPKQTGSSSTGQQYTWKFAETDLVFIFLDFPDSELVGSAADLAQIVANSKKNFVDKLPAAKLVSEKQYVLNDTLASDVVYDLGSEGFVITQFYLDKKRLYRSAAQYKDDKARDAIASIFKTFKLIPQAEVEAELQRKYDAMKPPPLPQTPVVSKHTSDAEDEGLKGKVRKVVEESEDKSRTWGVQGRTLSSVEYYDENGALTQRDSYDSKGNPFQITVYGYIDRKRVSNSQMTRYESDPPPAAAPPTPLGAESPRKKDPRYEYSFEFKYENGKLVERQMVYGSGKKGMRYVYKHAPNQLEELVYTEEGKLNQRYLSILDEKNNVIEKTDFGVVNYEIYGDRRYKYTYEFDVVGNWTKKNVLKEVKENGQSSWQPAYVSYRTITYN